MSKEGVRPEDKMYPEERWPIGRSIVERIRSEANDVMGWFPADKGADVFSMLYLTERDACIPDELIDEDLVKGIHAMYYLVLDSLCIELRERIASVDMLNIVIDPSYEDTTYWVVHTHEKVVLSGGMKAWRFFWESEERMAEDLEDWYRRAADSLPEWQLPEVDVPGFLVTVDLRRVVHVSTDDDEQAIAQAIEWESNENDIDVQMLFEEVHGYRLTRIEPRRDAGREDQPAPDDGEVTT